MTTTDPRNARAVPRTGGSSTKRRRSHAALGARVATAGLGTSAMFAIVGLMGAASSTESEDVAGSAAAPPAPNAQVIVRVHRSPQIQAGSGGGAENSATAVQGSAADTALLAAPVAEGPIELTASPVVRTVQAPAAAPVARSNGSR